MREIPLKRLARVMQGQAPDGETVHPLEDGVDGVPFVQGNAEFGAVHPVPRLIAVDPPRVARRGSILLSVRAPVGQLNIARDDLAIGRGVAAVEAGTSVLSSFLWWVLHARIDELLARQVGSTYGAVDARAVATLPIPAVGIGGQRRIADFLDRESERIERLRRTIQSQLDGLQAFEMNRRDELLASRERVPMKSLLRDACVGIVVQPARLYAEDGEVPCFRAVNVHDGTLVDAELMRISRSDHLENRRSELSEGDVVVVRTGKAGSAAVVPAWASGGNCVDLLVLRAKPECDPRWLVEVINSATTAMEIDRASVGTIQGHMNLGAIRQITCPNIDVTGQLRVVSEIQAHRDECDSMARELRSVTGLLTEYRDALITEAVTGKLDVTRLSEKQMDESAHAAMEGERPEVLSA